MAESSSIKRNQEPFTTEIVRRSYYGAKSMRDRDLVDRLLFPYIGNPVKRKEAVKEVLDVLDGGMETTFERLKAIQGLDDNAAEAILSALELGRRKAGKKSRSIKTPEDVYNEIRHYADRQQEHLIVIALNGAHEVVFAEMVTIGLVNMTVVHPREVFSDAIRCRASSIVIAHNHCSGQLNPSDEDLAITKRIVNAGQILGIHVLDHLIISEKGYMSFKEKGLM